MAKKLVKKENSLPATQTSQKNRGIQDYEKEDQMIPRLKIMQGLSPEIKEGIAKDGDLVNSLTKENYGNAIKIVPVLCNKSRIYWQDRDKGGGILCAAQDNKIGTEHGACNVCEFRNWEKDADNKSIAPKCVAILNTVALIVKDDAPELIAVSFLKTSYNTGKNLLNVLAYKPADIFTYVYDIYAVAETNDLGTYNILKYRDTNTKAPEELYKRAEKLFLTFTEVAPTTDEVPF